MFNKLKQFFAFHGTLNFVTYTSIIDLDVRILFFLTSETYSYVKYCVFYFLDRLIAAYSLLAVPSHALLLLSLVKWKRKKRESARF